MSAREPANRSRREKPLFVAHIGDELPPGLVLRSFSPPPRARCRRALRNAASTVSVTSAELDRRRGAARSGWFERHAMERPGELDGREAELCRASRHLAVDVARREHPALLQPKGALVKCHRFPATDAT